MREPSENDYQIPGLEEMHGKNLAKMANGVVEAMEKTNEYPRLTLDDSEIQAALKMDGATFSDFIAKKGIDFKNPVMLITPTGTAEAWMDSPEDIMDFLRRTKSGNLHEEQGSQDPVIDKMNTDVIRMGQKVAREMEKSNEYPRLTLNATELKAVLSMGAGDFSDFLSQKGIDFKNPVMLTTPTGTAEAWMHSSQEIMDFLRRTEHRN